MSDSTAADDQPAARSSGSATTNGNGKKNGKGRRVALIAVLLVAAGALIWGVYWFLHRNEESTDDAFVQSDIAQIAPRVTGTVNKVFVRDNQHVDKGDALFTLDPSDYNAALAKAEANLEAARAEYDASQKNLSLIRQTSAADIDSAKAALENAQAEAQRTAADARRYRALYAKHEVSRQDLDRATTAAKSSSAKVKQARAQLAQAQAAPDQIAVRKSQASSAQAKIAQAKAELDQARLNLSYTDVRAPHSGQISKKSIVAGSHVSAGQSAMALVEDDPWVVANFKETQLTRMKPGQPVAIEIDAFPGRTFAGRLQSIQAGTGVTFSLLPPQNATGNFVKIVQRVPVKIIFSKPQQLKGLAISPGMSAVPTINLAGDIKPMTPAQHPATETAARSAAEPKATPGS
ncbi:MAG: HlyD family secretion protein [Salinisphaera sp.]|jgi:membrane fusion protein (multidrug efflux system)|nr:HlyD family secretion protein [Salinisphaera sp.]